MEVSVALYFMILLIGLAFIVLFGGLSLLRREGLSARFAIEALIFTGIVSGLVASLDLKIHPVLFLFLLYLVTMRVRLLVEIGTFFAKRGDFKKAERIYQFAARAWPDQTSSFVIQVNYGTLLLQTERLEEAVTMLKGVIEKSDSGFLGVKYESAAHYNLAVAYMRQNKPAQAVREFNSVLDTWPSSEFARQAAAALKRHQHKSTSDSENPEE
jgi:tetratricopeptide (TPR) repeat protein